MIGNDRILTAAARCSSFESEYDRRAGMPPASALAWVGSTTSEVFHVKYGVYLPNFGSYAERRGVAELAGLAERSGWDASSSATTSPRPEGVLPMADPWIMLTAIALGTSSVQIGALVTPLARRRPWNVAREVVTLDT